MNLSQKEKEFDDNGISSLETRFKNIPISAWVIGILDYLDEQEKDV